MLIDLFKRLNWPQAVVSIAMLALAGWALSIMPAELWSKIPSGVYWALGGTTAGAVAQSLLGRLFHPTPEQAQDAARKTLSRPPPEADVSEGVIVHPPDEPGGTP